MTAEGKKREVIVSLKDGLMHSVTHPADVRVITKDYDIEDYGDDPTIKTDETGAYVEEIWELE